MSPSEAAERIYKYAEKATYNAGHASSRQHAHRNVLAVIRWAVTDVAEIAIHTALSNREVAPLTPTQEG